MTTPRRLAPRASLTGLAALAFAAFPAFGSDGVTQRVSLRSDGTEANGPSDSPVITPDGVWVAFTSDATNLVAGDSNGFADVFVHNRFTKKTVRVSVGPGGVQSNEDSGATLADNEGGRGAAITPNGRFVAFTSQASNLAASDINTGWDVFVHDRDPDADGIFDEGNGVCQLVSIDSAEQQPLPLPYHSFSPTISDDGRYVAFQSTGWLTSSTPGGFVRVFVRDRLLGRTFAASLSSAGTWGDGDSTAPAISGNGRLVAFQSKAKNLVAGDSSSVMDIFVRDIAASSTTRVSVRTGGLEANGASLCPRISADGRWVVFHSSATNLVAGDSNREDDVFLHDRSMGITSLVSRTPGGSPGNDWSIHPDISPDGRWIVFESIATDLVPEDTGYYRDIFRFDRTKLTTRWISRSYTGWFEPYANEQSRRPSVDASGSRIAFESDAFSLVPGDFNAQTDAFVRTVLPFRIAPWR